MKNFTKLKLLREAKVVPNLAESFSVVRVEIDYAKFLDALHSGPMLVTDPDAVDGVSLATQPSFLKTANSRSVRNGGPKLSFGRVGLDTWLVTYKE